MHTSNCTKHVYAELNRTVGRQLSHSILGMTTDLMLPTVDFDLPCAVIDSC